MGLVLSHFSLGRHRPFEERVAAAATAGFAALGLWVGEYLRLRDEGVTDAALRAVLDRHGVRVVEVEALRGWADPGPAYRDTEREVFAMAGALGPARHVQVLGPVGVPLDAAAEAFAGVCDRAAEHGLRAAIEFLPEMTDIPDAATALDIVERAGRRNGGLCLDLWHHVRGGGTPDSLRRIPPGRIVAVQLSDGPRRRTDPDYRTDCTRYRQVPGEGEFDLPGHLSVLAGMGVRVPLSVEVLSTALQERPAGEIAQRLHAGTRAVLAAAAARPASQTRPSPPTLHGRRP